MTDGPSLLPDYWNISSLYEESETLPHALASSERLAQLQQTLDATRFYVLRIAALIVVTVGVIGNVVNILVLSKRSMKSSTSNYLCALAVLDILYLIFALTMTLMHYDEINDIHWYFRYKNICGRVLTDITSNSGVWITITFTVERYIGICYPMKGILTFPEFFEFKVVATALPSNKTILTRNMTDFGNSSIYHIYNHLNQAVFTFVPLVLLLIFNALLIRTVVRAARERRSLTIKMESLFYDRQERQRRREQGITLTLIMVVVVFLLCQLPQAIHKLHTIYVESYGLRTEEKSILLLIQANYFNLLVMINASVNFLLYSACSYEFRSSFRRLMSGSRKPSSRGREEPETKKPLEEPL